MSTILASHLQNQLDKHDRSHSRRTRRVLENRADSMVIVEGKSLVNFCSNDYLNISTHTQVKKAFVHGAYTYGLGSSGSALIAGYTKSHKKLEEEFAAFLNRDSAILFNSGFHANLGVITTFAGKNSTILADKYCHASLNAGALLSRAKYYRYRHNDLQHAEELLIKKFATTSFILTESIFSMQGNISNISKLSQLALQNDAMLIVDDAHGIGILGKSGAGITEHYQLSQKEVPCLVTPLGKAIGSVGAIVSGDKHTIEALLQFAGTYRYSTSLPPAICEATLAALKIVKNESWRRDKLGYLCDFFLKEASTRNLPLISNDVTPIKSIVIANNQAALKIQQQLVENGLLVSCIRPPTVPAKLACIKVSLNCMHDEQQIIYLLDQLKEQYELQ